MAERWWCSTCERVVETYRHKQPNGHQCPSFASRISDVTKVPLDGIDFRTTVPGLEVLHRIHLERLEDGAQMLPNHFREDTRFHFRRCLHTTEQIIPLGDWILSICVRCGIVVSKECSHMHCKWIADGKVLVCENCGVDAT